MNKRKKQPSQTSNLSLQEYLNTYSSVELVGILSSFETTPAWHIICSYLALKQREFEVASLDLVSKGQTHPAAHASGYAQAVEDIKNTTIQTLQNLIVGKSQAIENPRMEDEVGV